MKLLAMKLPISMCLLVALGLTGCSQATKKYEPLFAKDQTKTIVMQKVKMPVDGMVCNACQSNVKKTIKSIEGVSDVTVNLEQKFALFTFNPQKVKVEQIQKAVNEKGYTAGKPQELKQ